MEKFSDYNIISLGDHCAIPLLLQELGLKKESYPFDWVANKDYYDTNIIYNAKLVDELYTSDNVEEIVRRYLGNAYDNDKVNPETNIWFAHDHENINDVIEKYKRRFTRLKENLNKKNIFALLTRNYYFEKDIFENIIKQLLDYNNESIILFISGVDHKYFEEMKYPNVIFKYIDYDMSQYYHYDYSTFRPNVKSYLTNLLLSHEGSTC